MKAGFPLGWRSPVGMMMVMGLLVLSAVVLLVSVGVVADVSLQTTPAQAPIIFIENVGQFDPRARFLLRGPGMTWLAEDALWVTFVDVQALQVTKAERLLEPSPEAPIPAVQLKFSFEGANPGLILEPFGRLPTRVSYVVDNDPAGWRTGVPVWAGVRYRDLYPGIDLVLSADALAATNRPVPWRLEVSPGADLTEVQLRVEGAKSLEVQGAEMVLGTDIGRVAVPLLAVSGDGRVAGRDELGSGAMRDISIRGPEVFVLSQPVAVTEEIRSPFAVGATTSLRYGTYLGGSELDFAEGVAIDERGAIYVVGRTQSMDFPTVAGSYTTTLRSQDAFVSKFDPAGNGVSDLVYSTFIGGQAFDAGYGIVVSGGTAYIAGYTASGSFPTTPGALDRTCGSDGGCDGQSDGFFASLNAEGTVLEYGTFVGGGNQDSATGLAFSDGTAYLTGLTRSKDFPTTAGAYDTTCGTDSNCNPSAGVPLQDAFFVRLTPAGQGPNDLLYGTFLGGSGRDVGNDIAVGGGDAYVTGRTSSNDFPGTGYVADSDAFVLRIDPSGSGSADLIYSTMLGGAQWDEGSGIGVSGSKAFVTGETESADFPVTTGTYLGTTDAFFVQLDGGGDIGYGAYLGGSGLDRGHDLAVDRTGAAVLVGYTESSDAPTTDEAFSSVLSGTSDVFLARLSLGSSKPQHITYASYLGGNGGESAYGVAVDEDGHAFLTGGTNSTDFPTTAGAFDRSLGGTVDAFVTVITVTVPPALEIEKSTNGLDADEPPGLYLPIGAPITWKYTVTNTGGFSLTDVAVTDDHLGTICQIPSLEPETSVTCAANGTAGEGQYANLASVTGQPPLGLDAPTDTDLSHYFGTEPGIDLEKRTNGEDADIPPGTLVRSGATVTWTYLVTNTGNVALSGISVTDDKEGTASCPYTSLAPNKAMSCVLTSTAVVGAYGNSASATGTPPGGLPTVSDSDPSNYFGIEPIMSLEKSTSGEDTLPAPDLQIREGSPVTWTYVLSNTGNITLTNIRLEDDQIGMVSCPYDTLAAEESMMCTATGVAEEGQYTNTGVVMGTPPAGSDVEASDVSNYYGVRLALTIQKLTNGQDADNAPGPWVEVGEVVTWTYLVTNTGNVVLSEVVVMDDRLGAIDCVSDTLGVDQSIICEVTGTVEADQHANLATARGTYLGTVVEDSDPGHYFGMVPGVVMEKGTNGEDADAPPGPYLMEGSTVEWAYQVRNSGNITLTQVTVGDDRQGPVACPKTVLAPGELMACTASGTVATGLYENQGTVTGNLPTGKTLMSSDPSHYFGIYPDISVRKFTYDPGLLESVDAPEPPGPSLLEGQIVTWTYVITNSGDITLTEISLVDDPQGVVECPKTSLAPLETMTCQLDGVAEAGQYANSGEVRGTHPAGGTVVDSYWSHYFGIALRPVIDVLKTTNGVDANKPPGPLVPKGERVRWEYLVSNVGNVPVEEISLSDDGVGSIDCDKTRLEVGKSMTCAAEGLAEAGQYTNTATVVGTGSTLTSTVLVSDTDVSYYFGTAPAIDLTKLTNGVEARVPPGPSIPIDEPVTWTYVIENTGNVPLIGIMVVDDNGTAGELGDDVTVCTFASLPPIEVRECTLEGLAIEGPYVNVATVTASYEGLPVLDGDLSQYRGGVYQVYLPLVVRQGP